MSSQRPLRTALVGFGAVAELYYAPALRLLQGTGEVQLTTVYDPNPARLARASEILDGVRPVSDLDEVLRAAPALAIVASPQRFHAPQSIALLQSGASVLCEKPMASTAAEAQSMIEAARPSGRHLAIGLFRRFFPASQLIRALIQNGNLGRLVRFEISEGGPFSWPAQSASFFQKSGSAGGVLADLGVHILDLVLWWLGEPQRVVYRDDAMGGLEANCEVELEFPGNCSGAIRLSRDTALPNRGVLRFERGSVEFDSGSADRLELRFNGAPVSLNGNLFGSQGKNPANTYHQSFIAQLRNVVAAICGEEPLLVPGESALPGMELIERCYHERTLMPLPWLSEEERRAAEQLAVKH